MRSGNEPCPANSLRTTRKIDTKQNQTDDILSGAFLSVADEPLDARGEFWQKNTIKMLLSGQ
jgi:hypothetical protein